MFIFLKTLHITCAAFSFLGFGLRAWWMWSESPLLRHRTSRILPHIIDSALLLSAILMLSVYSISPLDNPWLISKIIVLVLYIALGTIALKRGKTQGQRMLAFYLAVLCYGHIVSAALTKSPLGYLAWLY